MTLRWSVMCDHVDSRGNVCTEMLWAVPEFEESQKIATLNGWWCPAEGSTLCPTHVELSQM